jgi:hypothetical protein
VARSVLPSRTGHQKTGHRMLYMTVAEFDASTMRPDRREELIAWVESLGVTPADVREKGVIFQGEHEYELHLTKYIRTEAGRIRLNRAADAAVTEPLIIGLGTSKSWPAWMGGEK